MHTQVHARALAVLDPALRNGPWREAAWDERARRFGAALVTALRDALATATPMTAVGSACAAARSELPLASAAFHETWSRVTLAWVVREAVRCAHGEPDEAVREALLRIAAEVSAAAAQVGSAEGAVAPTRPEFEPMVDAAREAFRRGREAVQLSADERVFMAAWVRQLEHIASLLAVGGHSVDSLVRGAVTRTDRTVRKDGVSAWADAPLAARQLWVQRGLAEASWALAAQVAVEQQRGDSARPLCLWLARTASQLAARVDRVGAWVPANERDVTEPPVAVPLPPPRVPAAPDAAPTKTTEKTMDNTKLNHPMLKTLEVDATEAAWRMAGSQFVKLTKEPIVALLSRHLGPDDASLRGRIAAFLDTELGTALLSGVLSAGLSAMPVANSDVTQRLARELRVRAMASAGDTLADVLMGPLRQVAVLYLQGQPAAPADPAALPAAAPVVPVEHAHAEPAGVVAATADKAG